MMVNEEAILKRAEEYISSLFTCLKLEDYDDVEKMVYFKFKEIKPKLRAKTKYQNTEKLIAILTYFCLKIQRISINSSQIINNSPITKKEFNDFYTQIIRYIPEYKKRNRPEYILQRISEIIWTFNLNPMFYYQAKKKLFKLWDQIKNTTDNIIAGLLSSICVLCLDNYKKKVKVITICDYFDIRMILYFLLLKLYV